MNNVNLVGNLGQDPSVRFFENENCLAEFTLAVNAFRNGEKTVDWIPCKLWGKAAKVVGEHCRKGSKIAIEGGSLKIESWQDRETGATRKKMFVNGNRVELLGSKQSGDDSQPRPPAPQSQPVPAYSNQQAVDRGTGGVDTSEIPF